MALILYSFKQSEAVQRKDRLGIIEFSILCPLAGILKNTTFRKLDLFPSSGEKVGTISSVGSVRNKG
jgi:hypothetical protein